MLVVGSISAVISGLLLPSISLFMGEVAENFGPEKSNDDTLESMLWLTKWILTVACLLFLFAYIFYAFWQHLAENISADLRARYLDALLI